MQKIHKNQQILTTLICAKGQTEIHWANILSQCKDLGVYSPNPSKELYLDASNN